MTHLKKSALLVSLLKALSAEGSWCGGTHLQKAAFLLQDLLGVPLGLDFAIYKYGPYSFELADDISAMQADEFVMRYVRDAKYAPSYALGPLSDKLEESFPRTLMRHDAQVKFVAKVIGSRDVGDLERLATAMFLLLNESTANNKKQLAKKLVELKPHVSLDAALKAVDEASNIRDAANEVLAPS